MISRRMEFHVRFLDHAAEGRRNHSHAADAALYEIEEATKTILEKHGLVRTGIGYGIPRDSR